MTSRILSFLAMVAVIFAGWTLIDVLQRGVPDWGNNIFAIGAFVLAFWYGWFCGHQDCLNGVKGIE